MISRRTTDRAADIARVVAVYLVLGMAIVSLVVALAGCGQRTIEYISPDGASVRYSNANFDTQIGVLEVTVNADGTRTLRVEQLTSEAATAKAVADAVKSAVAGRVSPAGMTLGQLEDEGRRRMSQGSTR